MSRQVLPDFTPELRIVARGDASHRLVVVFDTATDLDLKRSPRIVMVNTEGVTNITTEISELASQQGVSHAIYTGKIHLLTQQGEGSSERYLLAEFELMIEGTGKRDKTGQLSYPAETEMAQLVRQGVADAFADASLEMILSSPVSSRPPEVPEARSAWLPRAPMALVDAGPSVARPKRAQGLSLGFSKKAYAVFGLMAVLLVAAAIKIGSSSSDPVQTAVNKALANDPRARDEQVEITRNTLKEMGLDPGKNGDLGCLAAQ